MDKRTDTPEFWETSFNQKQTMWGFAPAKAAVVTKDLFVQHAVNTVLIPGIGYGRNAQVFRDSGMSVTGIEISATAIALAHTHYGTGLSIHHGSVSDMPFDQCRYDGIFCYALIHLLDLPARKKLIADCYAQLADGGYMVFTAISTDAPTYGTGTLISENRYAQFGGVEMFFYDRQAIHAEFGQAGLIDVTEIHENYPFFLIQCRKTSTNSA